VNWEIYILDHCVATIISKLNLVQVSPHTSPFKLDRLFKCDRTTNQLKINPKW